MIPLRRRLMSAAMDAHNPIEMEIGVVVDHTSARIDSCCLSTVNYAVERATGSPG
jgi:hypothetical protein